MGVLLVFYGQYLIINIFDIHVYGQYAFLNAVLVVLSSVSNYGIPNFSSRLIAQTNSVKHGSIKRRSLCLVVLFSLICVAGFLLIIFAIKLIDTSLYFPVCIYFISKNVNSLISVQLQAEQRTIYSKVVGTVIQPIMFIIIVLVINEYAIFAVDTTLLWYVIAGSHVVCTTAALTTSTYFVRTTVSLQTTANLIKWALDHGKYFVVANSSNVIQKRVSVIICGAFLSDSLTGILSIVLQLATVSTTFISSINQVLIPRISKAYRDHNQRKFFANIKLSLLSSTSVSTLQLVTVILIGRGIIRLFSTEFVEIAYWALLLMTIGSLVNAATGPIGFTLSMTRHESVVAKVDFAHLFLLCLMLPLFILNAGIIGACLTMSICVILRNTLLTFIAYRNYSFHTSLGILVKEPRTDLL